MHLIGVLLHEPHYIYSTSHLTILLIKVNARPQEAKTNSEHRHNGHDPSVPSCVLPPGFSVPPGAGAVERGPVLTASTSVPAVYFLSDCKTPPLQGVFCEISFLQTP